MPLYERTARGLAITDVVLAVLRSQKDPSIICAQHPMRVSYNSVFLIVPLKDLVADGNGVYCTTGQPTHTIQIFSNEDEHDEGEIETLPQVKVLERAKRPRRNRSQFHLQRYYLRHSKLKTFFRRIYLMRNIDNEIQGNVAILQIYGKEKKGK